MNNPFLPPIRPPGAREERQFAALCVRCGKCLEICPHNSIKLVRGRGKNHLTPYVDVVETPCQLCMKCPPVCPTGALDPAVTSHDSVKIGQAYILKDKCHNFTDGIMCMTCYDRCPLRGKGIVLEFGITPAITKDCAGCGVCAYVCPVDAIVIAPRGYLDAPDTAIPLTEHP